MNDSARIRRAQSCAADTREAANEFYEAVAQPEMALVMFFCSGQYDLDVLGAELERLFEGVPVVGCTTAGEIGPAGYQEHSISGASFPSTTFTAACGRLGGLQDFEVADAHNLTQDLMQGLESRQPESNAGNSFAFLMIDGLSEGEEKVTRALQNSLGGLPLVGGSAGDDMKFGSTYVYFEGAFHPDSAVLAIITTPLPFTPFKVQHFVPTDERVVVTAADADNRIIMEIDGRPAVEGYARLIGVNLETMDPLNFAGQPMVVMIDGTNYVRSIKEANPDGSLTLFCAIEEGIVLRSALGVDIVGNLAEAFAAVQEKVGPIQLAIGCDCILRKLEIAQAGLVDRVEEVFRDNNLIGFNGYGEQYRGVHVNQTLTGIAIGDLAHA